MKKKIRLLLIGGGSGGHLYPLLTLAQDLCGKQVVNTEDLHFIVADNGADFRYFESNTLYKKFTYSLYSVAKLRRYFSWRNFLDFFIFFKNIIQSFFFLLLNRPEKIFSKGGFVSLPFGISAFILRIPFFLHETDSVMGLSNKILSNIAEKVFTGFPLSSHTHKDKYIFVGNPVRPEFFTLPSTKENTDNTALKILLFGGSQGAQALNEWVRDFFTLSKNRELLSVLNTIQKNIEVFIISGKNKSNAEKIQQIIEINNNVLRTSQYKIFIKEVEFLTSDFIEAIHTSDIVITRAGGSIAELAAAQKCTVLIPLPTAANNHQQKNADYFALNDAVLSIPQSELYAAETYEKMHALLQDEHMQKQFALTLGGYAKRNVVENIIKELNL